MAQVVVETNLSPEAVVLLSVFFQELLNHSFGLRRRAWQSEDALTNRGGFGDHGCAVEGSSSCCGTYTSHIYLVRSVTPWLKHTR